MKIIVAALASCLALAHAAPAAEFDTSKFVADYGAAKDATKLPSGLMYKVIRKGNGGKPGLTTRCECHYEGRLATNWPSGKKFDSSYDRGSPTGFAPNQVIAGWMEAMQLMPVGSKWELVCPPDVAYGASGQGEAIPPQSTLVFTMELISCQGVAPHSEEKAVPMQASAAGEPVQTSGLVSMLKGGFVLIGVAAVAMICIMGPRKPMNKAAPQRHGGG